MPDQWWRCACAPARFRADCRPGRGDRDQDDRTPDTSNGSSLVLYHS